MAAKGSSKATYTTWAQHWGLKQRWQERNASKSCLLTCTCPLWHSCDPHIHHPHSE
ncbi:hypothetical protein I79_025767 [Cricetulus griseus]|uniref:Uncharacterized protein n=1 Tax=Cricetulus griseus TaxID=10029 RepID=G3IP63_CRIGR|nr:hypothetical protein I79_025767 [Cricetulus griseus]